MRIRIRVPTRYANNADIAYLLLSLDSLFPRLRDVITHNSNLAVALARLGLQLAYRLASERYRLHEGYIEMQIELTKEEREALEKYADKIVDELRLQIAHYEEKMVSAKCKSCIEARIAALHTLIAVILQIISREFERSAIMSLEEQ